MRRDKRPDFLAPQFVVAMSCVISPIGTGDPDIPVRLADNPRQGFCISHVVQGQVSADNLMGTGVDRQVQLPPDVALFLAVFFHLPLALTEDV